MDDSSIFLAPQLRALTELVASGGHMTNASAALGIPQSSMSRRIHALETTLRIPLLIREGRTVRLTPNAIRLAHKLRSPLQEIDSALADITEAANENSGTVRLGFPLTMSSGSIPNLLAAFRFEYPGITLQLKQDHGSALAEDLRNGVLDLAITIPPPSDLNHKMLTTQEIHVVIADNHPLAQAASIDIADLRFESFIANPSSYNLRQLTEQWCQQAGYAPNIAVEITEFETIRELIKRELGVALLPRSERPLPGTIEIPISGDQYQRKVALTWASARQTAATKRFAEFVLGYGLS